MAERGSPSPPLSLPPASFSDSPPPSSPPFFGFGPEEVIPDRIIVETTGEGEEEEVVNVYRKKRTGRPRGTKSSSSISSSGMLDSTTRSGLSLPPQVAPGLLSPNTSSSPTRPRHSSTPGTSSRPKLLLLDKPVSSLGFAKLPKNKDILSVFLSLLSDSTPDRAAAETVCQVKEVWLHHFGPRMILGFDKDIQEEAKKMIVDDRFIKDKIIGVWKEWKELVKTSKREDRANKIGFLTKKDKFANEVLDMPLNILRGGYEEILKHESGIKDWKEDLLHLHNQLQREQVGCCDVRDYKQRKRDNRVAATKLSLEQRSKSVVGPSMDQIEGDDDDKVDEDVSDKDENENFRVDVSVKKQKKVDVMGPISATADRLNLSVRERSMIAASVANALNVDIDTTNISRNVAWEKARKVRLSKAEAIRQEFIVPERAVVHWDGKICKVKGHLSSNRVAVYVTGTEADHVRKLLGAPEVVAGTGQAEAEVVQQMLNDWGIKQECCGLVFDTTSSNTGAESGACVYLEAWRGSPLLWLACRHHIHELHLKRLVQEVFGQTKDPGMDLFRRLKREWHSLVIDYDNLSKFDYDSVPEWIQVEARSVLSWAEQEMAKNTWPREDYRELLRLAIVCLGGDVQGFQFLLPGPDHHARWMSKVIYNLKMKLLSKIFKMSDEEKRKVEEVSNFVLVFYIRYWFESPLPAVAARNDLTFMVQVMRYKEVAKTKVIWEVLQSCYRHLWYLVPQTVIFALVDENLQACQREAMARKLHGVKRDRIEMGKPVFPFIDLRQTDLGLPDMSCFVDTNSWLVFDLLGLEGPQDWLIIPSTLWDKFAEFRKLQEFVRNISVCNDVAERGVALMTQYIDTAQSEDQRQALLQVVEFHRSLIKDTNKSSLKLC